MNFYSPLRYPGGKGKIYPYLKEVLTENLLSQGVYIEPYAGGASIALSLLLDGYVSKIIINDIDRSIFAFWHSVLNETDELCKLIKETPVNIKTWELQKEIQKNKQESDLLQLGFSTFFLNRTNRSGIIKAGVIGGKNQSGKWKINARYNKKDLIKRIKRISEYKAKIKLYNLDAIELVRLLRNKLPDKTLFYFDPPYYVKGKELYLNYYGDRDHERIALEINKIKNHRWIMTYDDAALIKSLYKNHRKIEYLLNYSAAKKRSGKELMIFSDNLQIVNGPLRVKSWPVNPGILVK